MTSRDSKTGRFLKKKQKSASRPRDSNTGQYTKAKQEVVSPPKTAKKKRPKKAPTRGKAGQFAKLVDVLPWSGGTVRQKYIMQRYNSIIDRVVNDHPPGIDPDKVLEIFAQLSADKAVVLMVTFLHMPGYAPEDDSEIAIPRYCVYIGGGLEFITKITHWIRDGFIIQSLGISELTADGFKPVHNHPLWSGDAVDTVDGLMVGSGYRDGVKAKVKPEVDYRRPKRPRKRDYKREKLLAEARARSTGKKVNKGNRAKQKQRAKERRNAKKETTT